VQAQVGGHLHPGARLRRRRLLAELDDAPRIVDPHGAEAGDLLLGAGQDAERDIRVVAQVVD